MSSATLRGSMVKLTELLAGPDRRVLLQKAGWTTRLLKAAVAVQGGIEDLPRLVLALAITLRLLATPEVPVSAGGSRLV